MCYMMSKQQYLNDERQELASPSDVFCGGRCGEELGSRSAGLAGDGGGRSGGTGDDFHGVGRRMVRWDGGDGDDALRTARGRFAIGAGANVGGIQIPLSARREMRLQVGNASLREVWFAFGGVFDFSACARRRDQRAAARRSAVSRLCWHLRGCAWTYG